jgi:two-component SAPR family response regulator
LEAEKSQNNLRVTLARLNQTLKIDCVQQDGQTLFLDKGRVFIDVWEFENILKEWQNLRHQGKLHTAEKKAQEAIALYRGDFLPEFYNPAIEDKQRELKQKVRELLLWLADRSKERLDWHEAISFAHKLIAIDPNDEGGHRVIMESLWQQGDKVGAIRQFERFKKNLEKELDITPTSETLELYNKIVKTV